MRLDEAKQILKNAGFILEDTETNDEEFDELVKKLYGPGKDWTYEDEKHHSKLLGQHDDLYYKVMYSKIFNLNKKLKDLGFKTKISDENDYETPQIILDCDDNTHGFITIELTFKMRNYKRTMDEKDKFFVEFCPDEGDWYNKKYKTEDDVVNAIEKYLKSPIKDNSAIIDLDN